jgi:probable HAF family extracellular repeat protein
MRHHVLLCAFVCLILAKTSLAEVRYSVTDLGAAFAGNGSIAYGINNHGDIVGTVQFDSYSSGFLYSNGSVTTLATLGGGSSGVGGINDLGQIVGSAAAPDGWTHAFLYQNGSMMDIGISGHQSTAYDINSSGDVVGTTDAPDGFFNAFLYHDGQTFYLNDLIDPAAGWHVTEAYGINDAGQIVGYGDSPLGPSGVVHAFLLTPVAVPEPSSVCLLAVCVPALLRRKRR